MRFIQHLLENTPSTKNKLLEVNSEDFLNVLLAAAGEKQLQESEMEGIPENMTVAELIDIYEGRMPPPRMNYSFDEVDPDVDAKSFSRSNKARRQGMADREYANRQSEGDYNREMGWADVENERTRSGRFHGTEEEEPKMPANRERKKGMDAMVRDKRTPGQIGSNNKRLLSQGQRWRRRMYGAE